MNESIENIIKVVKLSRWGFFLHYVVIIIAIASAVYTRFYLEPNTILRYFELFFIGMAIFLLAYAEIFIRYKRLIISNRRAMLEEGIFKKHSTTIRYSTITEVESKQSLLQRILSFGTLTIMTSGIKEEHELVIHKISNPLKVKNLLEHFMLTEHKV